MRAAQSAGITLENKKMRFLSGMVKRTRGRPEQSVAKGHKETSLLPNFSVTDAFFQFKTVGCVALFHLSTEPSRVLLVRRTPRGHAL
jgi:hypothetical protein